jgi:hypothetical protein
MDKQTRPTPVWHSLMYSTGFLLLVCGIPATVLLSILFMSERSVHLTRSEALGFGLCMVVVEAFLGGVLLLVAMLITKHRDRV